MPTIIQFRPSVSPYRFGQILRNEEFVFDVRWNSRDGATVVDGELVPDSGGAWYFDVRAIDLTPIALGLKVTMGAYFGRVSNHPLFRDGAMVARPAGADRRPPTFHDIGTRVQIWYYTRQELVQEIIGSISGGA